MKRYDSFIESKHNKNLHIPRCFSADIVTITVMILNCYVFMNLLNLTLLNSMRELPVRKIYKIREWTVITDTIRARLRTGGLINLFNIDYVFTVVKY